MLYSIIKIICRFCIQIYYGKIEVTGLDTLPKDIPLLLASNHPTGFLEPIIIACMLDRELHFITRGDLFSNKMLGPLLRKTNQIPIWRFKDGITGLRQNQQSIDTAEKALKRGGALLMFVEGRTEDIKMLKPLQKGMARISASLHEQGLDHRVIPVGINFIDTVTWRSRVMLNFGSEIDIGPFITNAPEPRQAYKLINESISEAMKEIMLHCPDRSLHAKHDKVLAMYSSTLQSPFLPIIDKKGDSFKAFKAISSGLTRLGGVEKKEVDEVLESVSLVGKNKFALQAQTQSPSTWLYMRLVFLLPIAVMGLLANIIPVLFGLLIEKVLVESREFVAPIRFAASMGFGLVFYIGLLIFSIKYCGWMGVLVLLGIPLGWVFLYWTFLYRSVAKKYGLSLDTIERLMPIFTLLKNVR